MKEKVSSVDDDSRVKEENFCHFTQVGGDVKEVAKAGHIDIPGIGMGLRINLVAEIKRFHSRIVFLQGKLTPCGSNGN